MLEVTYLGPHQRKDLMLPDGSVLKIKYKETAQVAVKHKAFLEKFKDLEVKDPGELNRDLLL